jgi:hypothetical protein
MTGRGLALGLLLGLAVPARAAAEPRLEHSEQRSLGLDSLVAASDEDEVYARLWAGIRGGFLRRGVFAPDVDAKLGAAVGVYDTPRSGFDVIGELGGGWPELGAGGSAGDGDMPPVSGRLRARGAFGFELADVLRWELELEGTAETALDGERSVRPHDVGPAPFRAGAIAPVVWLLYPPLDDDDTRLGMATGASFGAVDYLGPEASSGRHRIQAWWALGLRSSDDGNDPHRAEVRLPDVGIIQWSRPDGEPLTAIDFALRASFQLAGARATDSGGSVAFGADLGWAVFERDAADEEAPLIDTADMGFDFTFADREVGSIVLGVHHDPAVTPLGTPVGVTRLEVLGRLAPDEPALGSGVVATVGRIADLVSDRDDVWTFELGGEAWVRVDVVELGVDGGGGRGSPTGSMGWDPFAAEPGYWGRAGAFARAKLDALEPPAP